MIHSSFILIIYFKTKLYIQRPKLRLVGVVCRHLYPPSPIESLMFSSSTCSATCCSVAINQQRCRRGFSLLPQLPLPPSPSLRRLLLKPHTNCVPRGRAVACRSESSGEEQDEQWKGVSAALEESLPIKDLITIAACAVGLLTGIGVVLFNDAVHYLRDLFWDGIPSRGASWLREEPIAEVWQRVILVPVCGGLIVGILNKVRISLEVSSEGTVASNVKGTVKPFLKTVAASVTLGTGNSLGPEGPSVEIGSSIAKGISHVFEWSGGKRLSLVAAGSAAGISSGFNAAVAGCFFAVESVLWPNPTDSFLSLTNSTSMVILSSVIASVISEIGLGSDPAFIVPEYDFRSPSELPLYLLLGILCGLVSLTLSGCTSFALEVVENVHKTTRIPKTIYPAFGGLVVGLIALAYPEVLYWGFENVDILLESRPFVNGLPADVLFQLVAVKIVATSLSRASGLVGGYYAPSLFIGAATGMAYGKFMSSALSGANPLFHLSILEVASPQAYGLVGMAATLAGVCQVPLTSVLLLFELTQDYRIVLPLLGAVGMSSWIVSSQNKQKDVSSKLSSSGVKKDNVNQYKESINQSQVLEESAETSHVTDLCEIESSLCGYDSVGEIDPYKKMDVSSKLSSSGTKKASVKQYKESIYQSKVSEPSETSHVTDLCEIESSLCVYDSVGENPLVEKLTVLQAMRTRYVTVLMSYSLVEAVSLMLVEKQPCAIIIDENEFLVGLLSLENVQNFSKVAKERGMQTGVDKILVSHVCHLDGKNCQALAVTPDTTLTTAESIMNSHGVNQLPVVSEHVDIQKKGHLVGLLDRESINIACRVAATKEYLGLSSTNL